MDALIQKMLSARARRNSEPCANENLMAAYLEASLSPQEMTEFESHVSECATCQEVMALAMKLNPEEVDTPEIVPADFKKTLFRFSIPIPVLGALCIGAVLIAVFFRFANHSGKKPPATSVAELRQDVQKMEQQLPDQTRVQMAESHPSARPMKAAVRNAPSASSVPKPQDLAEPAPHVFDQDKKTSAEAVTAEQGPEFEVKDEKGKVFAPARGDVPSQPVPAAVSRLEIPQPGPAETAAPTAGNAFTPHVVQEPVARPKIYAAQNRIAATHYTDLQPVTSLTPMESLNVAINALSLPANRSSAQSRKIGDRSFLRVSGPWVDKQCIEHPKAQVVEIAPTAPEYESILKKYPDVRAILPAAIYWEGKNYLLKK
jgi:hypothetical protein